MKKPIRPILPIEPYKFNYESFDEEKIIYLYLYTEDCEDDPEWYEAEYPVLDQISLQDLVNMVPNGVSLSDIRLDINYWSGLPQLKVFYKKNIPANLEKYKEDIKKYKKDLEEYEQKLEEYDKNMLLYKKKKLQKELDKLNNIINSK